MWRQAVVVCACRYFLLYFCRPLRLCWKKHKHSQNSRKIRVYKDFLHNLPMWSAIQKKIYQHLLWYSHPEPERTVRVKKYNTLSNFGCVIAMTQSLKPIRNKTSLKALCKNAGDAVQSYWTVVNSESWFPKPCLACLSSPEGGGCAWIRVCRKPQGGSAAPRRCAASWEQESKTVYSWFEGRTRNTYSWQANPVMHFKD